MTIWHLYSEKPEEKADETSILPKMERKKKNEYRGKIDLIISLFGLVILTLTVGCDNGKRDIGAYYFPIEELRAGKVYEYQSVNNEYDPTFYYYYKTIEQNGNTYLTGTFFDPGFVKFQYVKEEMVGNGMLLDEVFFYEKDSIGDLIEVPCEIEAGNVFGFELSDPPSVLLTSFHWKSPTDPLTTITFVRNRQFDGDTTFAFQNKTYDCVRFYVRELVDNERGGHLETEYEATEIYAKGIGLLYFKKNVDENYIIEYALKEIYDAAAFEERFQINLD